VSLTELEKEVENLDSSDFEAFTKWIDAYAAKRWDAQFEQDVAVGKLDKLGRKQISPLSQGSAQNDEAPCLSRLLVSLQITA
jgi:hypothetical protein